MSKVVLKYHDTWSDPKGRDAASIVLRRDIRDLATEIELRIELSDFERPRRLKPRLDRPFIHLCGMVAMIICGDIHRQTMRSNERQIRKMIVIDIDSSRLPDELRDAAPIWIEGLLKELALQRARTKIVTLRLNSPTKRNSSALTVKASSTHSAASAFLPGLLASSSFKNCPV